MIYTRPGPRVIRHALVAKAASRAGAGYRRIAAATARRLSLRARAPCDPTQHSWRDVPQRGISAHPIGQLLVPARWVAR